MSHAKIKTNKGEIKIKLHKEDAPKTVQNFLDLAKKGYYKGICTWYFGYGQCRPQYQWQPVFYYAC